MKPQYPTLLFLTTLVPLLMLEFGYAIPPNLAGPLPMPTYKKSNCRLVINEMDLSSDNVNVQQFIELARYCPDIYAYQRAIRMEEVKLVIISHDGFLYGVCNLDNVLVPYIIPGDKATKDSRMDKKYWLYVIGTGYDNINFHTDKCELVNPFPEILKSKIQIGTDYPLAIGLIYTKNTNAYNSIKLERNGNVFIKTKVNEQMKNYITKYLQDFYIYGSQTMFQYCDYFNNFYKYVPSKHILLRDWNVESELDKSISRCSSRIKKNIFPMQPQVWLKTLPTPGRPNQCKSGFEFYIEDFQVERETPLEYIYGAQNDFKCLSYTIDEVNDVLAITTDENYREQLYLAEQKKILNDLSLNDPNESFIDEVVIDGTNEDVITNEQSEGTNVGPLSQIAFENNLDCGRRYIWKCDSFNDDVLQHIRNIPGKPISEKEVLRDDTCFWFEFVPDTNRFRCSLCHKLLNQGIIFDSPKYPTSIMKNGYLSYDPKNRIYDNTKRITSHRNSIYHKMSTEWFTFYDEGLRGQELENAFKQKPGAYQDFISPTKYFMITVKQSVLLGLPFRKFKLLTQLLVFFDVNIGYIFQSVYGMKVASDIISQTLHRQFCNELIQNNQPVSLLIDSTTDIANTQITAILFQTYTVEKGLQIKLYRILQMDEGEEGVQVFEAFQNSIRNDGIEAYIFNNLHAVTSDGAPNLLSVFNRYIDGITMQNIQPIWCHNHIYDIIYKNVINEYVELSFVSKVVNKCARFFKNSPKRTQVLKDVAADNGLHAYTIKKVHRIRWVSGNIRAFVIILTYWPYIVKAFQKIVDAPSTSFTAETKATARAILKDLKNPGFLTSLAFLHDVGNIFSLLALQYQTKGTTLISKKSLREDFKRNLLELQFAELPSVKTLITNSRFSVHQWRVETLEQFETNQVELYNIRLNNPNPASVGKRLFEKQRVYIDMMAAVVEAYFSDNQQDLYEVFNPLNFPVTVGRQENYGKNQIKTLNSELNWGYDENQLLISWENLLRGVMSESNFAEKRSQTPETFWWYYLSKSSDVGFDDITERIISRALSISSSNSQTERVLGIYKRTRTYARWSLQPKQVESILRIRMNSDEMINEEDAQLYAENFIKSGHIRTDTNKNQGSQFTQQQWDALVADNVEDEMDDGYDDDDDEIGTDGDYF